MGGGDAVHAAKSRSVGVITAAERVRSINSPKFPYWPEARSHCIGGKKSLTVR
jgi:hypothetical protein